MPHLCMIFEATGPYNAIGKIAAGEVRAALETGWRVTVVAKQLCETLRPHVTWRKLYVPPRGFALQWLTARRFIRRAMGDPRQYDVIHGHQPQVNDLCDVFEVHFLTRVAWEYDCLYDVAHRGRVGALAERAQKRVVLSAEDRHYRRRSPGTHFLFNSALTRDHFSRLYGMPVRHDILTYPAPAAVEITQEERRAARRRLVGHDWPGPVVGFLGGLHERKGYDRVVDALAGERDTFLLFGGLHSDGYAPPQLAGRIRSLGLVKDLRTFYAACDALLLPSRFEPLGLVALEAAAYGVPTIATRNVGVLPHLLEYGAGLVWEDGAPIGNLIRNAVANRHELRAGCHRLTESLSAVRHRERLLEVYTRVTHTKADTGFIKVGPQVIPGGVSDPVSLAADTTANA